MLKRSLALFFLAFFASAITNLAQTQPKVRQPTLTPQTSGTRQPLIAVSPVNWNVVWVSGRGGTFAVTTNGGKMWRPGVVPGAEALQFRDVQGVSDKIAFLLSIGNGAESRIYKTTDGGVTWTLQFQNENATAFFDCFAFWTPSRGFTVSDSVDGRFPVIRTNDGVNWQDIAGNLPAALAGESSFASSGTCVEAHGKNNAWMVTGGASQSRVLATTDGGNTWQTHNSPLKGSPGAGTFSVAFRDASHGIVGGGNLDPKAAPFPQTAISSDGGKTWTLTAQQPNIGTVFGVSYAGEVRLGSENVGNVNQAVVVTGPGGAAWTPDDGNTWFTLTGVTDYWGVGFGSRKTGWLVGTDGRILRIDF